MRRKTPRFDHFLPYQQAWIRCPASLAIAEKARRIGWTYASAFRAVQRRLECETDLFYTSADHSAAREFIEECLRWSRVFDELATDLGSQVIDERDGISAFVIRFKNGARIVAGSSNPKFFRGKGGDADADEFAFHETPRELFKAMHATAMVWGHQLRVWSTHNGEGSFFHRMIKDKQRGVEHFRVTILDAVEQGLVERIKGLDAPDEAARREWLEELRASCPDEDAWREEYLCEPSSEQSALLSYDLISKCEDTERPESIQNPKFEIQNPSSPLFAGFDVGRKRDRSVLWLLEQVGDVYHTREVRVLESMPFTDQEHLLHRVLQNPSLRRLCIDSTGIGAMLAERLKQRFRYRVEAVHFTTQIKSDLAMPLVRLFQDRSIRVPSDPDIREDLHKVRKMVTSAGNVRFDATRDERGHADRFWALALAYHAVERAPRRMFTLARKPEGW
jgi:phage FluMu gp28-like protein